MLIYILCFLLVPLTNVLLFCLSLFFSFPAQHWDWFIYTYHGIEVIIILILLVGKTSTHVKKAALCALIGGLIGCYVEWLIIRQIANVMFDAVTNGLP